MGPLQGVNLKFCCWIDPMIEVSFLPTDPVASVHLSPYSYPMTETDPVPEALCSLRISSDRQSSEIQQLQV